MYQVTVYLLPTSVSPCSLNAVLQGIYPTLIVILVALKKSHLENQFTSYGDVTSRTNTTIGRSAVFSPSAWGPTRFISASAESNVILSSGLITGQDSKTELGSKEGEKFEV